MGLVVQLWMAAEWESGGSLAEARLTTNGMRQVQAAVERQRRGRSDWPSTGNITCYHPTDPSARRSAELFCLGIRRATHSEEARLNEYGSIGGESQREAGARALGWLNGLFEKHSSNDNIWAWTHPRVTRDLIGHILGLPDADLGRIDLRPARGLLLEYEVDNWLLVGATL